MITLYRDRKLKDGVIKMCRSVVCYSVCDVQSKELSGE